MKTFFRFAPYILPVTIIIVMAVYLIVGTIKYGKMIDDIVNRQIIGVITLAREEGRGFFLIEINDEISHKTLCYSLRKSWFFKENNIKVGDKVDKAGYSTTLNFYTKINEQFEKCCDYQITRD